MTFPTTSLLPRGAAQAAPAAARRPSTRVGRRVLAQRGGTILGVILGIMAGLAVALGVALYVAKVPVPFVNKNTSRTSGQDAAEAERNRNWDPNAPLRSRNAAAPAAPGSSMSGAVVSTPAPISTPAEVVRSAPAPLPVPVEVRPAEAPTAATAPRPASEQPPARTVAPPASSDPLGDFATARARDTPAATAAAPAADPFAYFVQAGAFRTQQDADAQRARLSLMGVEARVTEREQAGRTVYRVRVGPFQNRDAADRVKSRLDGSGFESALVRVPR